MPDTTLRLYKEWSGALKSLRLKRGLSQNKAAKLADIDPAYWNRMEMGRIVIVPSRAVALRVLDVLGVGPRVRDQLLFTVGLAPVIDWQAAYFDMLIRLRYNSEAFVLDAWSRAADYRDSSGELATLEETRLQQKEPRART